MEVLRSKRKHDICKEDRVLATINLSFSFERTKRSLTSTSFGAPEDSVFVASGAFKLAATPSEGRVVLGGSLDAAGFRAAFFFCEP